MIVIYKAINHAKNTGPGLQEKEAKSEIRVKRYGPKEEMLQKWMESRENTKVYPGVNKDSKGFTRRQHRLIGY